MNSDNTKSVQLPKPVTVTGSAFPDPVVNNNNNQTTSTPVDKDELPMPAAVFDDSDEDSEPIIKNEPVEDTENKSPLDNLLPEIVPASSDPALQTKITSITNANSDNGDLPVVSFPPLIDESETNDNSTQNPEEQLPNVTDNTNQEVESMQDNQLSSEDLINNPAVPEANDQVFSLPQINVNTIPQKVSALDASQNDTHYDGQDLTNNSVYPQPQIDQTATIPQMSNIDNQNPKSGGGLGKIMLGIGVFLIGGGLVVGGYFGVSTLLNKNKSQSPSVAYQEPNITPRPLQSPQNLQTASPSATVQSSPKATTKATPKATVKPTTEGMLKVQILNGSGKKGDALTAKNLIQTDKFDITTGNAENFDFTKTTVDYKEESKTTATQFVKTLEKTYGEVVLGEVLADSNDYDFVITLGSDTTSESPTPSATAVPEI